MHLFSIAIPNQPQAGMISVYHEQSDGIHITYSTRRPLEDMVRTELLALAGEWDSVYGNTHFLVNYRIQKKLLPQHRESIATGTRADHLNQEVRDDFRRMLGTLRGRPPTLRDLQAAGRAIAHTYRSQGYGPTRGTHA